MIPSYLLYQNIFISIVIIMTLIVCSNIRNSGYAAIRRGTDNTTVALLLTLILAIWLGLRPPTHAFADTGNYAQSYYKMQVLSDLAIDESGEWIWNKLMYLCSQTVDVSIFFTIVSIGYFGLVFWSCKRLMPNNVLIAILFLFGALSFFTYGVNGIRNGLACSGVLLFLSYIYSNKRDKITAILIAFIVINIHRSAILPIAMAVVSLYFVRSFKQAYMFWIVSIAISLTFGNAVANIFAGLGFDDRMSGYLNSTEYLDNFSNSGFRWDFLLYSAMPIILGYYIIIKRGLRNRTYEFLLNTYILSNAFWVMVIRASFSNRFAYLSWFMYPLLLAYPLLKIDIWGKEQGKRLTQIMLAHIGFTLFMNTIYW